MEPGEIYWADLPTGRRPAIVVSREDLNRGTYVVAVLCTSSNYATRSQLPHCVPFQAGEFGLPKDCVAQCETISFLDKTDIDTSSGSIGVLDEARMREIIRAIGHVLEADCEPD